jgi:hypothetical protein
MNDKLDLRSTRALPYFMIAVTIAIVFEMIGILFNIMTDDFMLVAEYFIFSFIVGLYFCSYRLSARFKWMQYASVMFMCYVLISVFDNIFLWVYQLTDSFTPLFVISEIFSSVPDIFLILGIGFLIKCVVEEYKAMGMKKESDKSSKLLRLWIIAQVADMIVIDMMLDINNVLGHHTSNTTYIIVVATAILYTVTLVWICICIRKFSYDVYMDYYNKRSR